MTFTFRPTETEKKKFVIELYDATDTTVDININQEVINKIKSENDLEPHLPDVSFVCKFSPVKF